MKNLTQSGEKQTKPAPKNAFLAVMDADFKAKLIKMRDNVTAARAIASDLVAVMHIEAKECRFSDFSLTIKASDYADFEVTPECIRFVFNPRPANYSSRGEKDFLKSVLGFFASPEAMIGNAANAIERISGASLSKDQFDALAIETFAQIRPKVEREGFTGFTPKALISERVYKTSFTFHIDLSLNSKAKLNKQLALIVRCLQFAGKVTRLEALDVA